MAALSFRYDHQTIQYHEDDCFSCNTGVTTVKMSNVSEERRQELSVMNEQLERAKQCFEDLLNDVDTPVYYRRSLWLSMGGVLNVLADPSHEPRDLAVAWDQLRVNLRHRHVGAGNRLEQLIAASNDMERFFMTGGASAEDRAALQTWWYQSIIEPRSTNELLVVVAGGSPISSLSGPTDGETRPNVAAAQPVTAGAGNQGPARVAPAPAAAQAGVAAAPAVAEGGIDEGEHDSNILPSSLDYSVTPIQESTGSASGTTLDGGNILDDKDVESGGGTMDHDHPTGSGM